MKRITPEERERRINEKITGRYLLLYQDGEDKGTRTKYRLRCLVDGHEWSARYDKLANGGHGCPCCAGTMRLTPDLREQRINDIITGRYLLLYQDGDDKGARTKYRLRCLVDGHEWSASYDSIVRDRGCPCCAGTMRLTPEQREQRINDKIAGKYLLIGMDGDDKGKNTKYRLTCTTCNHSWSSTYHNIVSHGYGCPCCADYGFRPNKSSDFYVNIGIFNGNKFTKHGVTQQAGDARIKRQKRVAVDIDDYHEIWRESFESGEDALYAEWFFDSFTRETIPKENLPDGWTETNTTTPACVIALNLIFGEHRRNKKQAGGKPKKEQSFYDWLESQ